MAIKIQKETRYIKTPEVCGILGIERHTLYSYVKLGYIKAVIFGGKKSHYKFLRNYIENLVNTPEEQGTKKSSERR